MGPVGVFLGGGLVIQKKVASPNDFANLEQLSRTLLSFVDRYNQTATPFSWKFTASDLHGLMTASAATSSKTP